MLLLQLLYTVSAIGLAIIGFNTLILSFVYLRHNQTSPKPKQPDRDDLPTVLVQLPIYNEQHVVERLVKAAAKLDYPTDRLRIQLLDDSSDHTSLIAAKAVEGARREGVQIEHVRRPDRSGFKAGALDYGMGLDDAEFVAIFDADFVPTASFLMDVMPHFIGDEKMGMVQTRWAHLNQSDSLFTRAQALALDAHFVIEQTARHRSGLFMNFSGTGGVWRRTCIEESGGWDFETLSEDIDLSYRAQLLGWGFRYLPEVSVPAEIPPLVMGFKRQQSRWATGTIQCLRKMGGTILSSHLTIWQKYQAIVHLGGYFIHPLMILLMLTTCPLMLLGGLNSLPLAGLSLAMFGPPLQAIISQRTLYDDWKKRLLAFPVFMMMGVGIAVSNVEAVIRGFSNKPQEFKRTPKFYRQDEGESWIQGAYVLPIDHSTWIELLFALYTFITGIVAITYAPPLAPFMMLYSAGFMYISGLSLWQAYASRRAERKPAWQLSGGSD